MRCTGSCAPDALIPVTANDADEDEDGKDWHTCTVSVKQVLHQELHNNDDYCQILGLLDEGQVYATELEAIIYPMVHKETIMVSCTLSICYILSDFSTLPPFANSHSLFLLLIFTSHYLRLLVDYSMIEGHRCLTWVTFFPQAVPSQRDERLSVLHLSLMAYNWLLKKSLEAHSIWTYCNYFLKGILTNLSHTFQRLFHLPWTPLLPCP